MLKSTYKEHKKGFQSEQAVARFLQQLGYKILFTRLKTVFGEIDLIVRKDQVIYLIEIKTVSNLEYLKYRISKKQKQRLVRNYNFLSTKFDSVILVAAYVFKVPHTRDQVLFQILE